MRKNILILGHNYATQFVDIFNQYTRVFDKNEYSVTVVYLHGEPSDEIKERTMADEVIFLNTPNKSMRGLKINVIQKLLALCKQKHFQIVICHRYKPVYCMMWVSQFCPIPSLFFVMHELGTMSSLKRQLLIACLKRKNMLFAGVSNAVRNDMRKNLWPVPKERIQTLYNVIDIEMTEPKLLNREEARSALGLSPDAFVFGNIARLAINKDQKNLIHAFALIKSICPNSQLIILGDGELEQQLKEQVSNQNLAKEIIFAGFVPNAFRYMKAFDCFVLSSIQEAFGRVLLEAMVAKLPVIATAVHGIPEVLGEAGLLSQPQNKEELASLMQKIYSSSKEERHQQGIKALHHVKQNFSIPAFEKQFWDIFHSTWGKT